MLLLVGGISRHNSTELLETATWVSHTHEVLETLSRLTSRLTDVESAVRGYALTGESEWLGQQASTRDDVSELLRELRTLTLDNPRQTQRIDELGPKGGRPRGRGTPGGHR
jgi:methyl-accepting chemotaxis protein